MVKGEREQSRESGADGRSNSKPICKTKRLILFIKCITTTTQERRTMSRAASNNTSSSSSKQNNNNNTRRSVISWESNSNNISKQQQVNVREKARAEIEVKKYAKQIKRSENHHYTH